MMVTFTDSQVGEIIKRLARVQENAIAIEEERLYWKDVAEKRYVENQDLRHQLAGNHFQSQQSLKREVERLANRLQSTEEELVMTQKALVNSLEIIDKKNREAAAWKERESYQAEQRDVLDAENVTLREKLDITCFLLDAIRKNLTMASPWTDWHTKTALHLINTVLDAAKD